MNYVDKVPVCAPINKFLQEAVERGAEVSTAEVGDYHFHELRISIKGISNIDFQATIPTSDKLKLIEPNLVACECHWSTVKLTAN